MNLRRSSSSTNHSLNFSSKKAQVNCCIFLFTCMGIIIVIFLLLLLACLLGHDLSYPGCRQENTIISWSR